MAGLEVIDGHYVYEPDGHVLCDYLLDRSHVSIIRGPIGSGTSSASCQKIMMLAHEQKIGPRGKRRSRWAIVRNTYPELRSTTLETWLNWFPEDQYGKLYAERPMCHQIRINDVELDVYFLALDGEKDIQKLRSNEFTGIWFNEVEYIDRAIFDEAESRTGRFPSMAEGGSTWDGIIADLNAPSEDHWLPQMTGEVPLPDDLTEEDQARLKTWPHNWKYFVQPPAVLEIRSPDGKQVVGYKLNPKAENKKWLKPDYYDQKVQGKKKDWIDSRLRNKILFVSDGDPVWPSFNRDTHLAAEPLYPIANYEVVIGMDFGRRPCAIFTQQVNNRVFIQYELRGYNMSAVVFAPIFKRFLETHYRGFKYRIFGDPKGQDKGQATEKTPYEVFAAHGIVVTPAPVKNNNIETRISAVDNLLNELHLGMPRFVLSPVNCPTLVAGMAGRYHVKRAGMGDPEPVKDKYSDIADALQYAVLGMGEGRKMIGLEPVARSSRINVAPKGRSLRRVS